MSRITITSLNSEQRDLTTHDGIRFMSFPAGERHVYLPESVAASNHVHWKVSAQIYEPADIMDLLLLNNALRKAAKSIVTTALFIPYLPYARQDRLTVPGESVSIEVMAQLINSMQFDLVEFADVHSPKSLALVNNSVSLPASQFVASVTQAEPWRAAPFAVVCPDKGAVARTNEVAQALGGVPVVYCDKVRNPATGKLSGMQVVSEVPNMPLLLIDDICDGGGTFLGVGAELRKLTEQPLYLYVTHGLFTKGLEALESIFTKIYSPYVK